MTLAGLILNNAHIVGDIRIISTSIGTSARAAAAEHGAADAARFRDLRVEGSLFFRGTAAERGSVHGRVYLAGARIGGAVEFAGIDFRRPPAAGAPDGEARRCKTLTLANANIGGDLAWLDRPRFGGTCTASGRLSIDSSHIGGRLRIALETADQACLSLKACEVDAAIQIRVRPVSATNSGTLEIDASDAVADAIQVWGYRNEPPGRPETWTLRVAGTSYAGLAGTLALEQGAAAMLTEDFLDWFRIHVVDRSARRRHDDAFSPQPYQQFIALCRAEGFHDVADDAVTAWIKEAHGRGARRVFYGAFGLASKYGLDPGRATWSFVLAWLSCTMAVFGLQSGLPNAFVEPEPQSPPPKAQVMRDAPSEKSPERYRIEFTEAHNAAGFECAQRINPAVYALDVMLPVADFQQEELCPQRGRDQSDWRIAAVSAGFALFRILGTVLSAILLLALSGINRRIWR